MTYLILFLTSITIGFVAGLLVYRKHADRLRSKESEGRKLLDALKGK